MKQWRWKRNISLKKEKPKRYREVLIECQNCGYQETIDLLGNDLDTTRCSVLGLASVKMLGKFYQLNGGQIYHLNCAMGDKPCIIRSKR